MKILKIKKSAEFQNISKKGQKFHSKTVLLLSHTTSQNYFHDPKQNKNAADFCRVGYTVSKTVGNAVIRNRAKRRLRELFKKLAPIYAQKKYDYVLIARREIATAEFNDISNDLKFCLKRIHNMSSSSTNKNRVKT